MSFDQKQYEQRVAQLRAEGWPQDEAEWEATLEQQPGGDVIEVEEGES